MKLNITDTKVVVVNVQRKISKEIKYKTATVERVTTYEYSANIVKKERKTDTEVTNRENKLRIRNREEEEVQCKYT